MSLRGPRSRLASGAALAALLVLAVLAGGAAPPAGRPAGTATVIVPDEFLRPWDPVTIFFARDLGPAGGGPEDHAERFARLEPDHPGAFAWLDARTLQFRPADPWPPLARFTWSAGGSTARLDTLMAPPLRSIPANGEEDLEPVDSITLAFSEPLAPETLRRMLSIELRPLPGIGAGAGRVLAADDFEIKALERRERSDTATYVLALDEPIPLGTRALVHFRLSLAEAEPEAALDLVFATAEPFRVVALGCGERSVPVVPTGSRYGREQALRCDAEERRVVVEFSAEPAALDPVAARNLLRFEPAVHGLTFTTAGRLLEARGDFGWDTLYRVILAPTPLRDTRGRILDLRQPSEVHAHFPRRAGYLRWGATQGVVERFGPQMVPLEGRGDRRVDLRIHAVDPLDRSFWPFPESPVVVDEAERPPGPGEEPPPWTSPDAAIGGPEIARRLLALGSPPVSTLVELPLRADGGSARFGLDLRPHLERIAGAGRPGTYLVGVRRLERSTARAWMRVQATDLALTALEEPHRVVFAVTSLRSAAPIPGATVRVEGSIAEPGAETRWETLFEGSTDGEGRVAWPAPGDDERRSIAVQRLVVAAGDDHLVLDPSRPPDGYADGQWFPTQETWLQWTQQELGHRGAQSEVLAHLFTERPVYRPEETVHIKGYLRRRDQGRLHPEVRPGALVVVGPGDLAWRYPQTPTGAGSVYHAFAEEKLPTGLYTAHFEDRHGQRFGEVSFRVEAYRLPTFEVSLHAPDRVPLDREFSVALTASYYAGGRVAGRPVGWRVTQFPYAWTPKRRPGFLYSSDGRFSRRERFESTPRLERQDSTDGEGGATLVLNPAIEPTAQPRSYVVEATVTGADDQTVTATRQVVALPPFVLGLKVARYIERAERLRPEIVVVGPDDKPLAGVEVTVRLLHRQWHSHLRASDFSDGVARYTTDVVDEQLRETRVVSAAEPVVAELPLPRAGVYVVELEASDRLGRAQVVAVDLYAGGEGAVAWSRPPAGVFTAASDKPRYLPGETAAVVLQSPFQSASALAVVETPDGNRYSWLEIEGGSAVFRLPIEEHWAPRLPVHFVLQRGRVPGTSPAPGNALDLGRPSTVASTAWLEVEPVAQRVEVTLRHPEKARPGERIEVGIELRSPGGPDAPPLPGEVTLWLVDQAVLALGREQRLDPLPDFLSQVLSHLAVRDVRNLVFGLLPFAEIAGGDGDLAEEAGSLLDRATLRRTFQPVPYYDPAIQVGPDGRATVAVELPDNLTNFKLRAKAASGAERFGFATGHLAVRLPVVVQPALPRFVRPGDRFTATAVGRVVEGEGGAGRAEVRAEGLEISGPTRHEFQWPADRPQRLEFPARVPTPAAGETPGEGAEVVLRFAVERAADGAADAVETRLPVRDDRRRVVLRQLAEVAPGAALQVPALAEPARPGTLRREIVASTEPALLRLAAALDFLIEYPYGCTEQRLSQARGHLALRGWRERLAEDPAAAQRRLERAVREALDWLPRVVDERGLCAYWPGSRGYVSLTAWALEFLTEARAGGFAVDERLAATISRALQQALRSDYGNFIDGEAYAERAWALAALADAGKLDAAYAAELARRAQFLDLEAKAEVLRALARGGEPSAAGASLARELWQGIVVRLHQGREIYGGLQGQAEARNGLILPSETRTLAEMARALGRADAGDPRLALLVEALVTLGRGDGWGTTNASAAALLALTERLAERPAGTGAPPARLTLRAASGERGLAVGGSTPLVRAAASEAGALELALAGAAARPVGLRVETSYLPQAEGSQAAAAARGFVVARAALRLAGEDEPLERQALESAGALLELAVGDVVEEHVRVVNPAERHYVAVVVPLAAGLEPLNPALATAPPEARPRGGLTREPSYVAFLDDHVAFYFDTLPKGSYDFYFRTRAAVAGEFTQPGAFAEMMYDESVFGQSSGARVRIERREPPPG
jgi:uncharacterized protein YfaS (alpha-2-macroglobulin family)